MRAAAEPSASLEAEGWTRRFTAIGARLSEAIELYRKLGYELRLEAADAGEDRLSGEACAQCLVTMLARTIYTRWPIVTAASTANEEPGDKGPQKG